MKQILKLLNTLGYTSYWLKGWEIKVMRYHNLLSRIITNKNAFQ